MFLSIAWYLQGKGFFGLVEVFRSQCETYIIPIEQKSFPVQGPTDNVFRFPNNISREDIKNG